MKATSSASTEEFHGRTDIRQNAPQEEQAIIAWLQQNAIPLRHIEAGHGFADLQPLKRILADAKVVGLGETTHGTREFFQIKHRLLEFLVTEMAFTAFVLEASYAACQPINEYVLHGRGDRATVLTGQGYIPWDTEEFSEMLDWLRAYNQGVPDEKKVSFHGVDLWRNEIGRKAVLAYLCKIAPGEIAAADSLFEVLAREEAEWPRRINEEAKWPMRINEEAKQTLREALPQLQGLIDHLTANKDEFARSSSLAEFDHALHYAQVMKQWVLANTAGVPQQSRSPFMAENLMMAGGSRTAWREIRRLGAQWARQPGPGCEPRLPACGRSTDRDTTPSVSSSTRGLSSRGRSFLIPVLGDLKAITLPPAPAGSLPWYLSRTHLGNLMLDLRAPAGDPAIERWLHAPQIVHTANWVCPDGFQFNVEMSIAQEYDGIVFVERTTPTRPTANALKTAAEREGL